MEEASASGRVGRRGFIQSSSAAAAFIGAAGGAAIGVGLEHLLADSKVAWTALEGGPDSSASLLVVRPHDRDTVRAHLELVLATPQGVYRQSLGEVVVSGQTCELEVELAYPFDDFVYGEYSYQAIVSVGGQRIATTQPIRYSVEPFLWFS